MEPGTAPVQKKTSGPETLTEDELRWLARYKFLKEHGYLLRPRYRPGWTPSWETTPGTREIFCEDWYMINVRSLLSTVPSVMLALNYLLHSLHAYWMLRELVTEWLSS